ncbi:copper resistance D family protein [Gorillibacterium massiliense]|uniref:copper resistance D family protein n=1 Tax=Gorillibacterium massiliense TaxID=1280390 RepID=UPI0004B1CB42|nr:CopD family protein [Gorillibacterium massiliense]
MIGYYLSEFFLYCCFAILTGGLILRTVPEERKPEVRIPSFLLILCTAGIAILSFFPVYKITRFYQPSFEMAFWPMLKSVLTQIDTGKTWIWTLVFAIMLLVSLAAKPLQKEKAAPYISLIFLFLLMLEFGWGSHTSAFYGWKGFFTHTLHFIAAMVWIGLLLLVGWFSVKRTNWAAFLKWFSPLSIVCVVLMIAAGIGLMLFMDPDYADSWMLPYGQTLLIKHLLIIPLLTFAMINGLLMKRRLAANPDYDFSPWIKGEGILALVVFAATAVMGQQNPPHDVALYLQSAPPSRLFTSVYSGTFTPDMKVSLQFAPSSLLLGITAILCLIAIIAIFRKKWPVSAAMIAGLGFAVSAYFSFMLAIA